MPYLFVGRGGGPARSGRGRARGVPRRGRGLGQVLAGSTTPAKRTGAIVATPIRFAANPIHFFASPAQFRPVRALATISYPFPPLLLAVSALPPGRFRPSSRPFPPLRPGVSVTLPGVSTFFLDVSVFISHACSLPPSSPLPAQCPHFQLNADARSLSPRPLPSLPTLPRPSPWHFRPSPTLFHPSFSCFQPHLSRHIKALIHHLRALPSHRRAPSALASSLLALPRPSPWRFRLSPWRFHPLPPCFQPHLPIRVHALARPFLLIVDPRPTSTRPLPSLLALPHSSPWRFPVLFLAFPSSFFPFQPHLPIRIHALIHHRRTLPFRRRAPSDLAPSTPGPSRSSPLLSLAFPPLSLAFLSFSVPFSGLCDPLPSLVAAYPSSPPTRFLSSLVPVRPSPSRLLPSPGIFRPFPFYFQSPPAVSTASALLSHVRPHSACLSFALHL